MKGTVPLLILAGLLAGCTEPEPGPVIERVDGTSVPVADIEARIPPILEAARLPGLQVAVINDREVVYTKGFGVKSVESMEPVTDRTVFAALSFSKTLLAYLAVQLAGEGVLDLDEPLVSYLPQPLPQYEFYRDLEGDETHTTLTARMTLTHTTGFPNWRWFTPEGTLHFIFEPGERFSYSGEGILLLQFVIEEITGEGVEDLGRARIFEPLGLERTSFVFRPAFDNDFATDHDRFLSPIGKEKRDEANAAGSAQTTAGEYATFLAAAMWGPSLDEARRREMLSPQVSIEHVRMFGPLSNVPRPRDDAPGASWALGWGRAESDHGPALFHTGNDRGAANYHVAYPDRGIAVVLMGNSQTLESAAPELTRLIIGDEASPFGFLGYEPYDAARGRIVRKIAAAGFDDGMRAVGAAGDKGIGLWYADEWGFLDAVGRDLLGLRHYEDAARFYESIQPDHPDRVSGFDRLATAHVALGRHEAARDAYREGLSRSGPDSNDATAFRWKLEWIEGVLAPRSLPEDLLREYAGSYGPRHVALKDGALYYHREGSDSPTPRRLLAVTDDTFVLEEMDSFRLRFDRDAAGSVVQITGLYMEGHEDVSPRDTSR